VWWLYSYDDPETGKHFDFEWQAEVRDRSRGNKCPFLSGRAIWPGFNDLATRCPKLAKQWHPTKNGNLKPTDVTPYSDKKVWWLYSYDDPETGKHFDFEWEADIFGRARGKRCPYFTGNAVWPGFNDLASKYPELAKQWHPSKNEELTPSNVTCGAGKKAWWLQPYDDPKTGKHFDFEWEARIADRVNGIGCPYLSGQATWPGFNDLATQHPDLVEQWHPTKNGDLKATDVASNSKMRVHWLFPYDDPKTGKHFDFVWAVSVYSRVKNKGCPYLSGQAVWPGFNDFATKYPELAKQWHPTKNGNLKSSDVAAHSDKNVWWLYSHDDPETGQHFDFIWRASIKDRVNGDGCPFLSGAKVWPGFNDFATKYPELAKEWHPTKNRKRTPDKVYKGEIRKSWWLCLKCGAVWRASVRERTCEERMCPVCSRNKDIVG
jgi:hypothetical protein